MKALNQPESWWGWHGWNQPEPLSITQIMRAGTMTPRVAALLTLAVEHGRSLILAADPPGAGKTTILTALFAFARPDASVYFTRGWGETFRLPPIEGDAPTFLLINEISDHLPVYSWGPYVQRAFELAAAGYPLLSTMHADTVEGVIDQLVAECDVPEALVGHLAFAVPLYIGLGPGGQRVRRVSEVAVLSPLGGSYERCTVARWEPPDDRFDVLSTPAQINATARRLGLTDDEFIDEFARRESFLAKLLVDNVTDMEAVQRRVFEDAGYTLID